MPELPEVETVRRGLERVMAGQTIDSVQVRRLDLRRPFPRRMAERLAGETILRIRRAGKYLLADFSSGETLIMHLGMSGAFTVYPPPSGDAAGSDYGLHDHVVFVLESGTRAVFTDPRRFGMMDLAPTGEAASHPLIAPLGPDPLGADFSAGLLSAQFKARRTPIKPALMNQRIVAGLGNIYVCESLWRSRISPRRRCHRIAFRRIARLTDCIRAVLREAIEAGGSTLRDHHPPDSDLAYFQHSFSVYGKESGDCPRESCTGRITRIVQSGRSTFYCPVCQT